MSKHFENLWEDAEQHHKPDINKTTIESIIQELVLKLNLYKAIDNREAFPKDQKDKIKLHTFGEIIMALTQLSLKDNVNAFKALNVALHYKNIEELEKKY